MTSTKALFKQMFLQKRHYADLVLLIQTFAVAFMFLMGIIFKGNGNPVNNLASGFAGNNNIWDLILSLGILTTFLADVTFFGLMCWQNEKINLSQTWQLIPASGSKIWIINIVSSIVECAYIFIIQIVIGLVVVTIDSFSHNINPFVGMNGADLSFMDTFWPLIEELLTLVGLCLIIFAFVSLTNFLTRTIADQLPMKNTTGVRLVVMAILVIVGVIIAFRINDQVLTMYTNHLFARAHRAIDVDTLGISALEYWLGAILLGIINCLLIQKFVEPKIINH